MSYTVYLYKISDDYRSLEKTLINGGSGLNRIATFNVNFKESHNMSKFTITYRPPTTNTNLRTANYILNLNTSRYYIIDEIVIDPTGLYSYTVHLDVLMTYASQLKALNCTLDRSETIFNGYLPDSEFKSLGYRAIACVAFPTALNQDSFILMTTG